MKIMLSLVCTMVLFSLTAAKAFDEVAEALEMNQEEVVETPPPWVTEKKNTYTKIGCFKDRDSPFRALPVLVENFRLSKIDWTDLSKTVQKCADAVKDRGYKWFAVQFYGECWSGPEAWLTYNRYGPSDNCWKGVGKHWTNMVYRLNEGGITGGNNIS